MRTFEGYGTAWLRARSCGRTLYTAEILALSAKPSIASLLRNRDPDDKDNAALKNALVVTDRVESGFVCLTQSLHDTIASLFANVGIALSMELHCFQGAVQKAQAKRKREKKNGSGC